MAYLLPIFSNKDLNTISEEVNGKQHCISSSHMPYELIDHPTPDPVKKLFTEARFADVGLLIGCDTKSLHTIWGSADVNEWE